MMAKLGAVMEEMERWRGKWDTVNTERGEQGRDHYKGENSAV